MLTYFIFRPAAKEKPAEAKSQERSLDAETSATEESMEIDEQDKTIHEKSSPKKSINKKVKSPTKERNLFEKLNSERQLSGLSLLSEAATLSLQELNKEEQIEAGILTKEEEEKRKWEENRPSFLSEHAYYAMPQPEGDDESTATLSADEEEDHLQSVIIDHNYALQPTPEILEQMRIDHERSIALAKEIERQAAEQKKELEKKAKLEKEKLEKLAEKPKKGRKRKVTNEALLDITNKERKVHRELANLLEPVKPKPVVKFKPRTFEEERQAFFHIFNHGIDTEDVNFLKKCYETLLQTDDPMFYWLNDILWVDHTITNIADPVPPKRRRKNEPDVIPPKHSTGNVFCLLYPGYLN